MSREQSKLRRRWQIVLALLLVAFAVVLLRTAWICDDAFITLRTVDNLVHGYGPRWNVDERVQSFTHPLWMLALAVAYGLTREAFYTVSVLSLLISLSAMALLAWRFRATPLATSLGILALLLSRAFIDYSTSGLENPLTYLLLVLFFIALSEEPLPAGRLLFLSLTAGLATLNRMDNLLLLAPALVAALIGYRRWRGLGILAAGFAPFAAWEVFSVVYYGLPYPNTALAKLNTGIPLSELAAQGLSYFGNSIGNDPGTLVAIGMALIAAARWRRPRSRALAGGILLYLLYVLRIGGDFMSGRLFASPLLLAVILLLAETTPGRPSLRAAGLAVAAILGLCSPFPTILSGKDYGFRTSDCIDRHGISDERRFYFGTSGLLNGIDGGLRPVSKASRHGLHLRRSGDRLAIEASIGLVGYTAGPGVHIVDFYALTDPLLSRLPMVERDPLYALLLEKQTFRKPERGWHIGHFLRNVPRGYLRTLLTGENRIEDPALAELYSRLSPILRGPLFDRSRLRAILLLNLGRFGSPVANRRPPYQEVDLDEYVSALPDRAEGYYARGLLRASDNRCDEARSDLGQALELSPSHLEAMDTLAHCEMALGNLDRAEELLRRAMEVDPSDPAGWMTLATLRRAQGRLPESIEALQHLLAVTPSSSASILQNLGNIAIDMGNPNQAEGWLRRSLDLDPSNSSSATDLGYLLLQQGRYREARIWLERASGKNPGSEAVAINLANLRLAESVSSARDMLDRFLREHPDSAGAHLRLGQILDQSGDHPGAVEHYRAAAKLGLESAREILTAQGLTW